MQSKQQESQRDINALYVDKISKDSVFPLLDKDTQVEDLKNEAKRIQNQHNHALFHKEYFLKLYQQDPYQLDLILAIHKMPMTTKEFVDFLQNDLTHIKKIMTRVPKETVLKYSKYIIEHLENKGVYFAVKDSYLYFFNNHYWEVFCSYRDLPNIVSNYITNFVIKYSDLEAVSEAQAREINGGICRNIQPLNSLENYNEKESTIAFKNGILICKGRCDYTFIEIKDTRLKMSYGATNYIDAVYEDKQPTAFEKTLDSYEFDEATKRIIYAYIGYCFFNHSKEKLMLWLFGGGDNGKSTLLEIIERILGSENVSNVNLANLSSDDTHMLINKKSIIDRELPEKFSDLKNVVLILKKLAAGNSTDVLKGMPNALLNRIIPIKMGKKFKEKEKFEILDQIDDIEIGRIIAKALETYRDVVTNDISIKNIMTEAMNELVTDSRPVNYIKEFFDDAIEVNTECFIFNKDLYPFALAYIKEKYGKTSFDNITQKNFMSQFNKHIRNIGDDHKVVQRMQITKAYYQDGKKQLITPGIKINENILKDIGDIQREDTTMIRYIEITRTFESEKNPFMKLIKGSNEDDGG